MLIRNYKSCSCKQNCRGRIFAAERKTGFRVNRDAEAGFLL